MRSLKLVLIPLACLAVVAGGCGGKKAPAETPAPPVTEAPPPPPPPPPPVDETPKEVERPSINPIYFDYDRYDLREDARATLATNAKQLESAADTRVTIEGHCDERGTTEYNLALGEKRAKAAYDYLVNYGIAGDRLSTVSFGEERPADAGHDEAAWAKNRRDEFVVR
jgi:peptidoglycan-associated lipoprotein